MPRFPTLATIGMLLPASMVHRRFCFRSKETNLMRVMAISSSFPKLLTLHTTMHSLLMFVVSSVMLLDINLNLLHIQWQRI